MFSWVSLALALLKFVASIMMWARQRELISEGYDKAIAEVTTSILRTTDAGKKIMARVEAMSPGEVDDALRRLEPQ